MWYFRNRITKAGLTRWILGATGAEFKRTEPIDRIKKVRKKNCKAPHIFYFAKFEITSALYVGTEHKNIYSWKYLYFHKNGPYLLHPICSFHLGGSNSINLPSLFSSDHEGNKHETSSVTYVLHSITASCHLREKSTRMTLQISHVPCRFRDLGELVIYKVVNDRITARSRWSLWLYDVCIADKASMRVSSIARYRQRALIMSSIIKIFGYI